MVFEQRPAELDWVCSIFSLPKLGRMSAYMCQLVEQRRHNTSLPAYLEQSFPAMQHKKRKPQVVCLSWDVTTSSAAVEGTGCLPCDHTCQE